MEPPRSIAEEESIRRQASEHEEEDGFVRVSNIAQYNNVQYVYTIFTDTDTVLEK